MAVGSACSDPGKADVAAALVVFQRDGIRVSDGNGTTETVVAPETPGGEHPDWSPDGTTIVFDTGSSTLWSAASNGGKAAVKLVTCTAPCARLYEGAWSPDGKEIAYAMTETADGTNTSRSTIQVFDTSTAASRTVYENTSGSASVFTPRWAANGKSLVFSEVTFASTRLDEEQVLGERIAVVAIGDSSPTARYLTPAGGTATTPDWSRRGNLIVFSRDDNLFTIRPDGTHESPLTSFDGEQKHAIQPTFLPDGGGVVFTYVTGTFDVDDVAHAAVIGFDHGGLEILSVPAPVTHPRVSPAST
jgi:TolB protein